MSADIAYSITIERTNPNSKLKETMQHIEYKKDPTEYWSAVQDRMLIKLRLIYEKNGLQFASLGQLFTHIRQDLGWPSILERFLSQDDLDKMLADHQTATDNKRALGGFVSTDYYDD